MGRVNPVPAPFSRGPETDALVTALRRLTPGESVTYGALSVAVGFDVMRYTGHLSRAREIVRRAGGGVVDLAEGGLRRLTDVEVVHLDRYLVRARNATRRGTDALVGVEYDALPDGEKVTHNVKLSMLGALRLVLSPPARRRLEEAVKTANSKLPPKDAIRLFDKVK